MEIDCIHILSRHTLRNAADGNLSKFAFICRFLSLCSSQECWGLSVTATDILGEKTESQKHQIMVLERILMLSLYLPGGNLSFWKELFIQFLTPGLKGKVWASLDSQTWQVFISFSDRSISDESSQKIQVILIWGQTSNIFQSLLSFCHP